MDEVLQREWDKLQLEDEEEEAIPFVGDVSVEKKEEIKLALMGKLYTERSFNARGLKTVMRNIWKPEKGLVIKEIESNLFLFQFFAEADKAFVMREGPWAYDGCVLLLKEITGLEQPTEIKFDTVAFWVKAYDVPPLAQTLSFAQFLAKQLGEFINVDESITCGIDKALCFQVSVDVAKPLRKRLKTVIEGKQLWVRFKYLKLPDYCYGCGKMGHTWGGCVFYDSSIPEEKLKFAEGLRASPKKTNRRGFEGELKEEKMLYKTFRDEVLKGARRKLWDGGYAGRERVGGEGKGGGGQVVQTGGAWSAMVVDEEVEVVAPNEAFKRKLEDRVGAGRKNSPEAEVAEEQLRLHQ